MLTWLLVATAVISTIALNILGTSTVQESQIHSAERKRFYLALIWCIPMLGVILSMMLINRDIKRHQKNSEQDILNTLKTLSENINKLEAGIQQKKIKDKEPLH
jgi:hypothetical protein